MDCETTNPHRPAPSPPPLPEAPEGGAAPEETDGPPAVDVIPVRRHPRMDGAVRGVGCGGAAQTLSNPQSRSSVWLQLGRRGQLPLFWGQAQEPFA